ncbi:unnamed protein product [Diabrotica balteata]|uniref:Uncharacterized protein n=1 Tax=Diabrotica balteata TaxID=107213 RepID=A0A9N9SN17_DIABA|nr:unnamed protein product [Diabrotica balteata]
MASSTPTIVGEISATDEVSQYKVEKIVLDGDLLSSSLPQLEMSVSGNNDQQISYSARKTSSVLASKKEVTPRKKSAVKKPTVSSSIPLPVIKPAKPVPSAKPSNQNVKSSTGKLSKPNSGLLKGSTQNINKHTLEIQFLNKKKRLSLLHKDLIEKQKPVLDLYQSLVHIKKKLEEFGKNVCLDEIKLIPYSGIQETQKDIEAGAGESVPAEVVFGMQTSIENIPKTLTEICKNLLDRRNNIIELLDSVLKSEIDAGDLNDQIEALKREGTQLKSHLDMVLIEHEGKIREIVRNWQKLLNDKTHIGSDNKIEELEESLKVQEKLTKDANQVILDLQKKLEDKRSNHDKCIHELNSVIHGLKDQIQKVEAELEAEKKNTTDYRSRVSNSLQASRGLRTKIADLEKEKLNLDNQNNDLQKKLKQLQDQLKHKESQWNKEREEMSKNMKHQENMLQKLSSDKSSFETRLQEVQGERTMCEETLIDKIDALENELINIKKELVIVSKERDEAEEKCKGMEDQISRLGMDNRATMNMVTNSINWGKDNQDSTVKADEYSESMMKDILIQEYRDKIKRLEEENNFQREALATEEKTRNATPSATEKAVRFQHDIVSKYKQLLAESEQKLTEKFLALRSQEVAKLTSEIRQLKVRQEHLEELNQKCPTESLQKMFEEGKNKLRELMKKSLESEQKIAHCEQIIDKQSRQMNEMENLLRYRENMAGVLKTSREELFIEKESLTKYSQELRTLLAEVTKEGKMKDRLIKDLQSKIDLREQQIDQLEKANRDLENNLVMTNEKRYKLQETIGTMEKELQSTKAHFNEIADLNSRYEPGMKHSRRNSRVVVNDDGSAKAYQLLQNYLDSLYNEKHYRSDSAKISSKSLLGLSLKQVEHLKSRMNYLTKVSKISPSNVRHFTNYHPELE